MTTRACLLCNEKGIRRVYGPSGKFLGDYCARHARWVKRYVAGKKARWSR